MVAIRNWRIGERVEAYWHEGGQGAAHYPAQIVSKTGNRRFVVMWEDGSGPNEVDADDLRPAITWETGQRVQAVWADDGQAYPATIVAVQDGKIKVRWDDGSGISEVSADGLKRRRGRPRSSNSNAGRSSVVRIPMDPKHEAFRRLAQLRTGKALMYIRLIGNLSDRRNYRWTAGEVAKIFASLQESLEQVKSKFSADIGRAGFEL